MRSAKEHLNDVAAAQDRERDGRKESKRVTGRNNSERRAFPPRPSPRFSLVFSAVEGKARDELDGRMEEKDAAQSARSRVTSRTPFYIPPPPLA